MPLVWSCAVRSKQSSQSSDVRSALSRHTATRLAAQAVAAVSRAASRLVSCEPSVGPPARQLDEGAGARLERLVPGRRRRHRAVGGDAAPGQRADRPATTRTTDPTNSVA